jgi:glycosyltransferase involved in cell wall biosynthesis
MTSSSLSYKTSFANSHVSRSEENLTDPHPHLRIAMMIESDGPGGAEMMVFRLAEELRKRGHRVVPVGPRTGTGWMGALFDRAGMAHETFWLKRPIDPTCVGRLRDLFRRHSVDVVHSHEFTMGVYGSAAAALLGIPHVLTVHGGFTATKTLRRRIALRWAIRRSREVIAVSSATGAEFARNLGVAPATFSIVHNGVPSKPGNRVGVAREFGIKAGEIVLLAVGNLERNKNHRMLLEALVRLRNNRLIAPWRLIIAAGRGGPEHEFLLEFVRTNELEQNVHIVMGRNDVADLLALSDVFVMPSLWEGLPMALLEAMVAGKAVIASETAGIPEALTNGREGLLVPPGNLDALTHALESLLTDKERRERLGAAASQRAHREFTIEVMTDRYLSVYNRHIGVRDAARVR